MGNYFSIKRTEDHPNIYCLKFDRILDADHKVYIGIGPRKKSDTTDKSLQVIRIGDYTNKYHRLLHFTEKENKLKYEFENDITMILKKKENNEIHMEVLDLNRDIVISKRIDPIVVKYFKPIKLSSVSNDFDKIADLFKEDSTQFIAENP